MQSPALTVRKRNDRCLITKEEPWLGERMVRSRRLELPRVAPQRPQRCASTNPATTARDECRFRPAGRHVANRFPGHKPPRHKKIMALRTACAKPRWTCALQAVHKNP